MADVLSEGRGGGIEHAEPGTAAVIEEGRVEDCVVKQDKARRSEFGEGGGGRDVAFDGPDDGVLGGDETPGFADGQLWVVVMDTADDRDTVLLRDVGCPLKCEGGSAPRRQE